jgi:branched-chain amino acid aminotransferase
MSVNPDFTKLKISVDGSLVDFSEATLHVASSAVLYGLSVYTVFPVNKTPRGMAAFRLEDHFLRLKESAHIMGIEKFADTWTFESFSKAVRSLIVGNKIKNDVFVRATVHVTDLVPGTRSRGLNTSLSMFVYPANSIMPKNGARLKTSVWRRIPDYSIPARAKVNGAYVNSVLGKQDAIDSGYDDCVFLDSSGHVCELSAANIFMVRGGKLITPDTTSDLLEGINRKTIIELGNTYGIPVIERPVDLTELYIADELFACGTSAFVTPITEVDARIIHDGKKGLITQKIASHHYDILHGKDDQFLKYVTLL